MGNCLETKLKEVVNNSNLEKMGFLNIYARKPASLGVEINCIFKFAPVSGKEVLVICSDGTQCLYDVNDSTRKDKLTMTGNYDAYADNAELKKFEVSKYDIERVGIRTELQNFNISSLKWSQNLRILNIYQDSANTSIIGDLNEVVAKTSLADIQLTNTPNISCNIEELGNYVSQLVSIKLVNYEGYINGFIRNARLISEEGFINMVSMPWKLSDGRTGNMAANGKLEWTANNFTLKNISSGGDIVVNE